MGWKRPWVALAFCCATLLSACGGGGGGSDPAPAAVPSQSSSGASAPSATTGGFTLSRTSVTVGRLAGVPGVAEATVDITAVDDNVAGFAIGYPEGVTVPSWLKVGVRGSGRNQQLVLSFQAGGLAPGLYKSTVRVVSGTASLKILGQQDVSLTLSVLPNTGTSLSTTTSMSFSDTASRISAIQAYSAQANTSVAITPNDKQIVALISGPSPALPASDWISTSLIKTADGWTLRVNASTGLSPGTYSSGVRVVAINIDGSVVGVQDIPVTLEIRPPLVVYNTTYSAYGVSGSTAPIHASVVLYGQALSWHASLSSGVPAQLNMTAGVSDAVLDIVLDISKQAPGRQTVTVNVVTDDGQTASVDIPVQIDAPTFNASTSQVNFSGINGTELGALPVSMTVNNGTNPDLSVVADAPWITVLRTGKTMADGLTIKVDPSVGPLASGSYQGMVHLSVTTGTVTLVRDVVVNLTLTPPTINVTGSPLQFGGDLGRNLGTKVFSLALNNGMTSPRWNVSASPAWLSLSKTSGLFQISDASVTAGFDRTQLKTGQTLDSIVVKTKVNGDEVSATIPVEVRLDQHKLIPSEVGVAFTRTPAWSRLTRQIAVKDNMGLATAWSAKSSQTWLKVTPSGKAGDSLSLTADPTGLTQDQLYMATVTITTTDGTVAKIEPINVGLWVGSSQPSAITATPFSVAENFVVDPVRPYLYTTTSAGKDVAVFNLYTGAEVARIKDVLSSGSHGLISPDGSRLYMRDGEGVAVFDLETRTKLATWPIAIKAGYSMVGRPNGKLMILAAGLAYDGLDGAVLAGPALPDVLSGTIGPDLSTVFLIDSGYSPSSVYKGRLDYTLAKANPVVFSYGGGVSPGSNGRDVAVSPDGKVLATASGAPYNFPRYDVDTLAALPALGGTAYPNNVEYGSDGRLFAGAFNWYDSKDLWVYNPDGSLHSSYLVRGYAREMNNRALKVSGDAFFAIVTTTEGYLKVVPVGP